MSIAGLVTLEGSIYTFTDAQPAARKSSRKIAGIRVILFFFMLPFFNFGHVKVLEKNHVLYFSVIHLFRHEINLPPFLKSFDELLFIVTCRRNLYPYSTDYRVADFVLMLFDLVLFYHISIKSRNLGFD